MNDDVFCAIGFVMSGTYRNQLPSLAWAASGAQRWFVPTGMPPFAVTVPKRLWYVPSVITTLPTPFAEVPPSFHVMPSLEKYARVWFIGYELPLCVDERSCDAQTQNPATPLFVHGCGCGSELFTLLDAVTYGAGMPCVTAALRLEAPVALVNATIARTTKSTAAAKPPR